MKQKMLKKRLIFALLAAMSLQIFASNFVVYAYSPGDIVINEVAWAGSTDNSNDEWIELFNATRNTIDLSGWYIEDDGDAATYLIESGEIGPYGYFLIAKSEDALSGVDIDAVIGLSLANDGDSLVLKDLNGTVMDEVNTSGGEWPAGGGNDKASMERIDPETDGDSTSNWADAAYGNGAKGSLGGDLLGTPGSVNSVFGGERVEVSLHTSSAYKDPGTTLTVTGEITDAEDVYAYGFGISYDPDVLDFVDAEEREFLDSDGVSTSFNYGLENGEEGLLIIGNARLVNPPDGISGDGELFSITFDVIGADGDMSNISFVPMDSFISDSIGDLPVGFVSTEMGVGSNSIGGVGDLQVNQGDNRYSLELTWSEPENGAEKYIIKRSSPGGQIILGETTGLSFVDNNDLIPNLEYEYFIIPVRNDTEGSSINIKATETRGIIGDNNRSDRVDGRDLENLARAYGSNYGDEDYDVLIDTTFDGIIDGSDLIDIGANFGLTY